jgi:hypothetical protein
MDSLGKAIHTEEIIPQSASYVFRSLTLTGEGMCHFGEVVGYDQDINSFFSLSSAVQKSLHTSSIGSDV